MNTPNKTRSVVQFISEAERSYSLYNENDRCILHVIVSNTKCGNFKITLEPNWGFHTIEKFRTSKVINEWNRELVAALVMNGVKQYWTSSVLRSKTKRLESDIRCGAVAVPSIIENVVEELHNLYVSLHGEDVELRKEAIRNELRRLKDKISEADLIALYREVTIEEVHTS